MREEDFRSLVSPVADEGEFTSVSFAPSSTLFMSADFRPEDVARGFALGPLIPDAYLYFLPVWDDYSPEAGRMHINQLKFSLYGGAACYRPSRLAEQSLNSMQLQHQQQQPVEKLLLLLKQ